MVTIGILSPGDMGSRLGRALKGKGARIVTCLHGRSARTRALAEAAGFEDLPGLDELVVASDILLSVLVPGAATDAAEQVADAIRRTGPELIYADCNAIAPSTARGIEAIVVPAGARFADVGLLNSRVAISGPAGAELSDVLGQHGLDTRLLSGRTGDASGLKMVSAGFTKGTLALATTVLLAAERLGLTEALLAHPVGISTETERLETIPGMTVKAHRWISEMEEMARTFREAGAPGEFHDGAANLFRLINDTSLADETPENRDQSRTLDEVIRILARAVDERP
jgi:3-hydroxyisobutyrate dehydrogenase-like beta-hydroxyacid dehydrogenase